MQYNHGIIIIKLAEDILNQVQILLCDVYNMSMFKHEKIPEPLLFASPIDSREGDKEVDPINNSKMQKNSFEDGHRWFQRKQESQIQNTPYHGKKCGNKKRKS